MSYEQATSFIDDVETNLGSKASVNNEDFSDVIPEELSIQDKLDIVNNSYKYKHLASDYNRQLTKCQNLLKEVIKFHAEEINALKATKLQSNYFDEIALRQRKLSYNVKCLFRLIQLYHDMSDRKLM